MRRSERGHAGDRRALGVEVGEGLVGAVEVGEAAHDLAGARTGEVDRGEALGDVGQRDVHAPVGQPPREPLLDGAGAARRRGDVEALVVEPADGAVVHDAPGVGGEHAVADAPGLEVGEAVGVQAVEELARLRAADDELAERRDVDEPGALVDGERLGLRVAVVVGAPPVARPHDAGAELAVAGVDGRALGRVERAPRQRAQRDGRPRRARGRGADAREVLAGLLRHEADGGQLAHAALARAHGRRRVALGELDRVVALVDAEVDVLGRDVLAQAREALAAPGARHGGGHGLGRARRRRGSSGSGAGASPSPSAWAVSAPARSPERSGSSPWPATAPAASTSSGSSAMAKWPRAPS